LSATRYCSGFHKPMAEMLASNGFDRNVQQQYVISKSFNFFPQVLHTAFNFSIQYTPDNDRYVLHREIFQHQLNFFPAFR
jgi:hypothetical protein